MTIPYIEKHLEITSTNGQFLGIYLVLFNTNITSQKAHFPSLPEIKRMLLCDRL